MKIFLLWFVAAFLTPALGAVGFEQLSVPDPPGKALPVAQMVVPDGAIAGTGLPLVLMSHGTAGSEASHYDTALALAEGGFVVAALTHTGDNYVDQSYIANRKDLTRSTAPGECCFELHAHNVGTAPAVGRRAGGYVRVFSLGGFTTLVESGGILFQT